MITLTDGEFQEIADHVRRTCGVDLMNKRTLVEGRLGFYVMSRGFQSFGDYFRFATSEGGRQEMTHLINRLTTNHTWFLREEEHFQWFVDQTLPWVERDLKTRDLRLWSAGCSSGQEPYSLSMTIFSGLGARAASWETTVLATDISQRSLQKARRGVYADEELSSLPAAWREHYFRPHSPGFQEVTEKFRKNVAFKQANLLLPFPWRRPFHAIFCRNVMIYFTQDVKIELIRKFHDALVPGGYLFTGRSEALTTLPNDFTYISPSVYRKDL